MTDPNTAPRQHAFDTFLAEMGVAAPDVDYIWSKGKELSCDWIIRRISEGVGVDVGGTHYIQDKLTEKGCMTYLYDLYADVDKPRTIRDDMFNIMDHFEPGTLDFITTRHTLEHALIPMFQLWAYNRLLKENGRLFVIVPQPTKGWIWFGTHHNCLPHENWLMLFYRTGFKIKSADAGSWRINDPFFIEYRFELMKETSELRMEDRPYLKRG